MLPEPRLYLAASVPLLYLTTILPSFCWFFVGRMRRPVHMEPALGRRVALVTLCVPSHETLDVIADQLRAMTAVRYPHDGWVLDEGADPDVERLALEQRSHAVPPRLEDRLLHGARRALQDGRDLLVAQSA